MAFFLQCLYTEALFILLVIFSLYLSDQKKYFYAFLIAGIASGTRVVGIFLLPTILIPIIYSQRKNINMQFMLQVACYVLVGATGLAGYIWYLGSRYKDPFLFLHTQSAFGANRSSSELVLLPQVLFRYLKILITVDPSTLTFWISVSELAFLFLGISICYFFVSSYHFPNVNRNTLINTALHTGCSSYPNGFCIVHKKHKNKIIFYSFNVLAPICFCLTLLCWIFCILALGIVSTFLYTYLQYGIRGTKFA